MTADLTRRTVILLPLALPAAAWAAGETAPLGDVRAVTGDGTLTRDGIAVPLVPGTALVDQDRVTTGEAGLALLWLNERTQINLGPASTLELASFLSEIGGTIQVGGAMVFDRPDDLPPLDATFVTAFGEIGVRGTRFFVGPSRGQYAVFVQRGHVTVSNAGVTRDLHPGDGCAMFEGAAPGEVSPWGEARIVEAFASLGLTRD